MVFTNKPVLNADGSVPADFYDRDYWEDGAKSGKGSYNGNDYADNVEACKTWAMDMYNRWGPFKRVLELGCGRGWNIYGFLNLPELGVEAVGIDISQYAIETAHPDVKPFLLRHDISDLEPWADGSFDLMFSNDVLEHLTLVQLEKCLSNCRRVAKSRVVHLVSIGQGIDMPFGSAPPDQDQSHVTMKSRFWWQAMFSEMFMKKSNGPGAWWIGTIDHGSTIEFDMRRTA